MKTNERGTFIEDRIRNSIIDEMHSVEPNFLWLHQRLDDLERVLKYEVRA